MPQVVITLRIGPTCWAATARSAGDRVDAAVGQRRRDQRQVAAVDQHRALAEVQVEHRLGRIAEDLVVAQHVADGAIAMAGAALRFEHRLVERERATGIGRQGADHPRRAAPAALSPRTSEAMAMAPALIIGFSGRPVLRLEADRVEGVARRLDADLSPHRLGAAVLEGDAVDQRLGDRLDRERLARRADLVDLAVDGGDGDAEPGRVGLRQLGDIAGDLAAAEAAEAGVQLFEVVLDRRSGAGRRRRGGMHASRKATSVLPDGPAKRFDLPRLSRAISHRRWWVSSAAGQPPASLLRNPSRASSAASCSR